MFLRQFYIASGTFCYNLHRDKMHYVFVFVMCTEYSIHV